MFKVRLIITAAILDKGAGPAVAEVSGLGRCILRRIGEAESACALVIILGDIREGNPGTVFNNAAEGEFGRKGAKVLAGFALQGEAIVLIIDNYANLIPVLPGEGGGSGT